MCVCYNVLNYLRKLPIGKNTIQGFFFSGTLILISACKLVFTLALIISFHHGNLEHFFSELDQSA